MKIRRSRAFALSALLAAAACAQSPTGAAPAVAAPADGTLDSESCYVNPLTHETRCGAIATSGGAHQSHGVGDVAG